MDAVFLDLASLCLRWLHMIAGMAWIGASFYFIHLDLGLKPVAGIKDGSQSEVWEVHGGGFYRAVKYLVAPPQLPAKLVWFKWEAYSTWLSGFALMIATYYVNADLFLIDPSVLEMSPNTAIAVSIATLLAGWLGYEALCRSPLGRRDNLLAAIGFVFLVAIAYGFTHVFSGRGAFIQTGALIGTIMVANVFVVIIPGQKKMVASMVAGEAPDPEYGRQGKQRSVHNNYLTLPVVFLMISNHYPLMFGTRYNWLIFAIVLVLGFLIRHFYNLRHAGRPNPWWTWALAAAGIAAIAWLAWSGSQAAQTAEATAPHASFADAADVVSTRCIMCHTAAPVWAGIVAPPKGVRLDSPEEIRRHAGEIRTYAVLTHTMPPGNVTDMSEDERQILAAGLASLTTTR
ncbi:MAG TPA: urate hydroxylase PuuD [Alphaproteobacteria bacterium]|nr:urate hydroxylase PuuD [Alphaproteobacteria bacterium]